MSTEKIQPDQLPNLAHFFRLFNSGKHLNRVSEPALWAELEKEQEAYTSLFGNLGFELAFDGRGYAWFHTEDASQNTSKTSRQLALLFMVLFEFQADAGKPLLRFADWRIDKGLLNEVYEKNHDLLDAEELDSGGLLALLGTAERYGFTISEAGHWRLLPAVCRYLDHFEELAQSNTDEKGTDWLETDKTSPQEDE
tara:strand:+ start:5720 stop:6307 length:588 start_codon:yes stop_codon:yes gene_type:complete